MWILTDAEGRGIIPAGAGRSPSHWRLMLDYGDHPRGCGEKKPIAEFPTSTSGSSPRVRGEGNSLRPQPIWEGIIPAGAGRSNSMNKKAATTGDHPRGCGEKWVYLMAWLVPSGSSPRVRGEALRFTQRRNSSGIIPAGAGRSSSRVYGGVKRGDHPRGCGEKPIDIQISNLREGSSPRVRGEDTKTSPCPTASRIIPAGAGRRSNLRKSTWSAQDHPRGCGEKETLAAVTVAAMGSSPRVRGEEKVGKLYRGWPGIIPAGAGRRSRRRCPQGQLGDHPRGCGEKACVMSADCLVSGSSPRVRGEEERGAAGGEDEGIIPAGAGRREKVSGSGAGLRDHPRGCGEKRVAGEDVKVGGGSSPRVRGEVVAGITKKGAGGIIPAGAGRSASKCWSPNSRRDHPRGCGEKSDQGYRCANAQGSSPRVRGEEAGDRGRGRADGIIPAGAGRSGVCHDKKGRRGDHPRGCGEKVGVFRLGYSAVGSSPRVRGEAASSA